MLPSLVRYLHDALVPFRMVSTPSPERLPMVAVSVPSNTVSVQTKVMLADGRPILVCFGAEERIDPAALQAELGTKVVAEGSTADLSEHFRATTEPLPPFGALFGVPLIVDEGVCRGAPLAFHAFEESALVEVPYDDFARLEHPRVGRFASAAELPERTAP